MHVGLVHDNQEGAASGNAAFSGLIRGVFSELAKNLRLWWCVHAVGRLGK